MGSFLTTRSPVLFFLIVLWPSLCSTQPDSIDACGARDVDEAYCTSAECGVETEPKSTPEGLVLGSNDAERGRFPYMVTVKTTHARIHKCGGVLIAPRLVLTAAHCARETGPNPIVHIGAYDVNDGINIAEAPPGVEVTRVERMCFPPAWNGNETDGHDIALGILQKEIKNVAIPSLPHENNSYGHNTIVSVLGWGLHDYHTDGMEGTRFPSSLRIAMDIAILDHAFCPENVKGYLKRHMICGFSYSQNVCQGDSGGPLLIVDAGNGSYSSGNPELDEIIGVISFGDKCDIGLQMRDRAAVYTSVVSFLPWIRDTISAGNKCLNSSKQEQPARGRESAQARESNLVAAVAVAVIVAVIVYTAQSLYRRHMVIVPKEMPNDHPTELISKEDESDYLEAAKHGYKDGVRHVLSLGVHPDAIRTQEEETALMLAANRGHCDVVEVLLQAAPDTDRKDKSGFTALSATCAAKYNHCEAVRLLLRHKADLTTKDESGNTPLMWAILRGHHDVVTTLLASGACVNVMNKQHQTPLSIAALRGHSDMIGPLIAKGADKDARDEVGDTALMIASSNGHDQVARVLAAAGGCVSIEQQNRDGDNSLMIAASHGYGKTVEIFLEWQLNLEAKNKSGKTAFMLAAICNRFPIMHMLKMEHADVDAVDQNGETALLDAIQEGRDECVRKLLDLDASPNVVGQGDETALHRAARKGNKTIVECLLNKKANKKAKMAVHWSDKLVTPWDVAEHHQHHDLAIFIKKWRPKSS